MEAGSKEKRKKEKNNIEKYIALIPIFIILDASYIFGEFLNNGNSAEGFIQDVILKNFLHPQVSVHSHEISGHPCIVTTKDNNVPIVNYCDLGLNIERVL